MTIFNSAYHTTALKGLVKTKIEQSLEEAYIRNAVAEPRENVYAVREGYENTTGIPIFNYPFLIQFKDKDAVFFDARTLVKTNQSGDVVIRDELEFQAKLIQAQLALDWHQGYVAGLRDQPLGLLIYCNWLGEVIAKRFALDPLQQLHVSVLAGIFYLNCFWDKTEASKEDVGYLQSAITRIAGYKHSDVADLVETYPIIRDVEELCECIRNYTQSVRLVDLNPATLYAVVSGNWFGNNGKEAICAALEYPPVWLTIIFQAITNRGFKRSGIGQVVDRNSYKKHYEGFVRFMASSGEINKGNL